MLFLCSVEPLYIGIGSTISLLILFFIYPFYVNRFIYASNNLLKEGKIREYIVKIIKSEYKWLWALLSYFFMAAPAFLFIFLPFFILLIAFPVYFASNFALYFLNKQIYNPEERNLLLKFYGTITFLVIILGLLFKLLAYISLYGEYFWIEIYYYYVVEQGRDLLIYSLIFVIAFFLLFYFHKYFEIKEKLNEKY
ncbi:MAG: hypothetical protein ACP5RD_02535 [bacterium]